jgi:APA family basic amino acid/polyamine antiporter
LLFFVEYWAWFIGWNYALLYQMGALAVVVSWSKYVVRFINLVSGYNATTSIVEAPVAWDGNTLGFLATGAAINLPAIAITLAITVLLVIGIRQTAIVNLVLVVIKIIILLIFIFATCKYVNRDNYTPFFPSNQGT